MRDKGRNHQVLMPKPAKNHEKVQKRERNNKYEKIIRKLKNQNKNKKAIKILRIKSYRYRKKNNL